MNELTQQARAAWMAFHPTQPVPHPHCMPGLALSLACFCRALAFQVAKQEYSPPTKEQEDRYLEGLADGKMLRNSDIHSEILSIANELDPTGKPPVGTHEPRLRINLPGDLSSLRARFEQVLLAWYEGRYTDSADHSRAADALLDALAEELKAASDSPTVP